MAHFDVKLQSVVFNIGIPLLAFLIIAKVSRKWVGYGFSAFYAAIMSKVGRKYSRRMHKYKAELFTDMEVAVKSGRSLRILDVGAGGGSNFRYFPANSDVICVEPNAYLESYARKAAAENKSVINLMEFIVGYSEDMSMIPSDSIDAVVCSLVLCNVVDIVQSLSEIKRVLKPGGKFYYLEHVCADTSTWTYMAQRLINPLWQHTLGDGCRFTQKTWLHIDNAGFSHVKQHRFIAHEMGLKFLIRPHLLGIATK